MSTTVMPDVASYGVLGWVAFLIVCGGVAFYYTDRYALRSTRTAASVASRLSRVIGLAGIVLACSYSVFSDDWLGGAFPASLLLLAVGLLFVLARAVVSSDVRRPAPTERVLILGASELTLRIIDEIDAQPHLRYEVVGIIDDGGEAELASDGRLVGPLDGVLTIAEETNARRIIVALAERRGRLPVTELLECQRHDVLIEDGVHAYERLTGKVPIQWVAPSQLLFSHDFCRSRRYDRIARTFMRVMALMGLIVTAPLFFVIGIAIKLDSRGPVLFSQRRIGLFGRPFRHLEFRTMMPDARSPLKGIGEDARRVTRVGAWLRKFRLDGLPQLINMLRGDMVLIGPPPHPVSKEALFKARIPHYALRHRVRPGVTGWSQVRYGYANNLDEETETLRFDFYYIKHRSFTLDVRIVLDTMTRALFGRGETAACKAARSTEPLSTNQRREGAR